MAKYYFKMIVTFAALCAILYLLDWALFRQTISSVDLKILSIPILLFVPSQVLAAYRWYFILARLHHRRSFWTVFYHNVLGQLSTLILPGQVSGDVVRFVSISYGQREKLAVSVSIVIDKLALLLAVAVFVLIGICAAGPISQITGVYVGAITAIIIVIPVIAVLCQQRNEIQNSKLVRWLVRVPYVGRYCRGILEELPKLPQIQWESVASIVLAAVFLLSIYTVGAYCVALAMQIEIDPVDWIAINAIVSFVQVFPITLGGIGVREGAFGLLLSMYGVPSNQAIIFSLTAFSLGSILTGLLWIVLTLFKGQSQAI